MPQQLIAAYLQQPRLLAEQAHQLAEQTQQRWQILDDWMRAESRPRVLVAESEPILFLAGVLAALAAECPVFLGNHQWTTSDWQQAMQIAQPNVVFAATAQNSQAMIEYRSNQIKMAGDRSFDFEQQGWIMIPTGGSSGQMRFAIHTWETLTASVQGFQHHFQLDHIHSCCVLPLYHVSGLMQLMRCLISGGTLALLPFSDLASGLPLQFDPSDYVISLVPTQLQRLLQSPIATQRLAQFQMVLLGGGPSWPDLLAAARSAQIRLALTYGMTETASQVATLKPAEFLAGHTDVGTVLPHASITIESEIRSDSTSASHGSGNGSGKITIQAASLALGYYPHRFASPAFQPDDVGFFDEQNHLHILGRSSDKIITGGEKVFPAEVEAAIRATGLVRDVVVIGVGDRHWGEVVTAIYVPQVVRQDVVQEVFQFTVLPESETLSHCLKKHLKTILSPYKRPKSWLAVSALPRNAQGKLNRHHIRSLINNDGYDRAEP